jgi:hypothetical protein
VAGLRFKAPKLKIKNVIMCCLVRRSGNRSVWINARKIIRAKLKKLEGQICSGVALRPPEIAHKVTRYSTPTLRNETSRDLNYGTQPVNCYDTSALRNR